MVTVPVMEDEDLARLGATVAEFAARNGLTIMPVVPQHDYGPEVCLGPDDGDLPGLLNLAGEFGGGLVYLRASPFDPGVDGQPDAVWPSRPMA